MDADSLLSAIMRQSPQRYVPKLKGRYSGRKEPATPERIAALREKYRNGVTTEIMREFEKDLGG